MIGNCLKTSQEKRREKCTYFKRSKFKLKAFEANNRTLEKRHWDCTRRPLSC
jgi:hypothetical protein